MRHEDALNLSGTYKFFKILLWLQNLKWIMDNHFHPLCQWIVLDTLGPFLRRYLKILKSSRAQVWITLILHGKAASLACNSVVLHFFDINTILGNVAEVLNVYSSCHYIINTFTQETRINKLLICLVLSMTFLSEAGMLNVSVLG